MTKSSYYNFNNWEIWTIYFLLVNSSIVVVWKAISKWIKGFNTDKKKMIGKKLEFLFFIFLFLSTYFLSFIIAKVALILMSNLFSISAISALFCGWLHYFQEVNEPKSKSGIKYEHFIPEVIYTIFVGISLSVLFLLFLILILPKILQY